MERLLLMGVLALTLATGAGSLTNIPQAAAPMAAYLAAPACSPDGEIDGEGSDRGSLPQGEYRGIYYILDTDEFLPCDGALLIVELDVPSSADFDLFLVKDGQGNCQLDEDDELLAASTRGTGEDERLEARIYTGRCYFIIVYAYSGSGTYEIWIGIDI